MGTDPAMQVRVTSADPDTPLSIDPNYFATEHDRDTAVGVFRRMRRLFATGPLAGRIERETVPGHGVQTNQEIIDAGLIVGGCGYHAIGTCAMGPDNDDVGGPVPAGTRGGEPTSRGRLGPAGHGLRQPQRAGHGTGLAGSRLHRGSLTAARGGHDARPRTGWVPSGPPRRRSSPAARM
jgi:hypothetical protein